MQTVPWQSKTSNRPDGITILDHSRGLVVRVRNNISVQSSAGFRQEVLSAWEDRGNPPRIVLDLTDVHQIDSSGVGALMSLSQMAAAAKVPFIVCGLQEGPRRMLLRTGLGNLLRTSDSVEEALLGVSMQGVGESEVIEETATEDLPKAKAVPRIPVNPPAPPLRQPVVARPLPPVSSHTHTRIWTAIGILLGLLLVAGGWSWWAVGTYRGSLDLIPAIHDDLAATGKRLDATEAAIRDWNAQRAAWGHRLDTVENRVDGAVNAARAEAEVVAAKSQQRIQVDLDRKTHSIENRLDSLQAAQKAADARLAAMQSQIQQTQPK
ncbi:MAG: STAS domain-containing protein [Bryobacteraceae bacterium]